MSDQKNTSKKLSIQPCDIVFCKKNHGPLLPGQRVLVYKPTDSDILSSSGKKMGKKEDVIGIGRVENDGQQSYVILAGSSSTKIPIKYFSRLDYIVSKRKKAKEGARRTLIKPFSD